MSEIARDCWEPFYSQRYRITLQFNSSAHPCDQLIDQMYNIMNQHHTDLEKHVRKYEATSIVAKIYAKAAG
jgi:hypothetical protein